MAFINLFIMILGFIRQLQKKRLHQPWRLQIESRSDGLITEAPFSLFFTCSEKKSPLASSYYHPTISLPKQIFLNPRNVETLSKHQNSNLIMVQINSAANSKSYLGVLFSLKNLFKKLLTVGVIAYKCLV